MVRLRDSWRFSLSSAPTVGNPCRPLQPETVSLADLQAKIIAAGTRLSEATQARDQAQGQLASVQKELETWRQQQAQGAQQLQDQMQQLFRARAETQEVEQRRMAALSEITAHPQAKADRSQELADVGNQLEAARQ